MRFFSDITITAFEPFLFLHVHLLKIYLRGLEDIIIPVLTNTGFIHLERKRERITD